MSTRKLKSPSEIKSSFEKLFKKSEEERIEHRAQMLSFVFLSEAEKSMENAGMNRKELAEKIGTTPSYLTQLFRGDRLMNLKTAAKIEHALEMEYEITVKKSNSKEFVYQFTRKTQQTRTIECRTLKSQKVSESGSHYPEIDKEDHD